MNYIKVEEYKIKKSWQGLLGYILVTILTLTVIIGYKVRADFDISGLDIVLVSLGNIVNSLVLHFITALSGSLLFAGEFANKTYKYIMIRPVSVMELFTSKLLAIWYHLAKIMLFIAFFSLIVGMILWGIGPVHGHKNIILNNGLLRIIVFYIGTWINLFFVITLVMFFSVLFKNQLSTVIITMGLFILLIMATNIIPELIKFTPIVSFNLPSLLANKDIK